MSPDLFFWYALAFKVAMTATIVVVVSVAAERSGPFIAALIAALPTAAGATSGVALVVAVVTTASHWIGSFASGVFAVFPIVMASFVMIMHPRAGGKAAAAVLAHAQPVLVGLPLGFLGVHYLAGWIGVWWSFAAGLAITMAWSAALWLMRRSRLRIA